MKLLSISVPTCEIVPGLIYLSASAKEGLPDLKTQLQNHILAQRHGHDATDTQLVTPLTPNLKEEIAEFPSMASLSENLQEASSDGGVNRGPTHANQIHPGFLTPGFNVSLLPSFLTPKAPTRTLSHISEEPKLSIKLLSIDTQFKYQPVANDYGPFCLGQIVRFVRGLTGLLRQSGIDAVVCYCQDNPLKRLNAALLLAAYVIMQNSATPEAAVGLVENFCSTKLFRDASMIHEHYDISLRDCADAIYAAIRSEVFSLSTFNLNEYEYYASFDNGDINIVLPGKLIAFSGPSDFEPLTRFTPSHYCEVFKVLGVTNVIRLNYPEYDPKTFCEIGITHHDLYFPDGCAPSIGIVSQFLDLVERSEGIVAVHCRAGLGRTGTCIALYLIKHFNFTANEATSWVRICRPGSIVGCQYHFLVRLRIGPYLSEEKANDYMLNQAASRERTNDQTLELQSLPEDEEI